MVEHWPRNLVAQVVEHWPRNLVAQVVEHWPRNLVAQVVEHWPRNLVAQVVEHWPRNQVVVDSESRPRQLQCFISKHCWRSIALHWFYISILVISRFSKQSTRLSCSSGRPVLTMLVRWDTHMYTCMAISQYYSVEFSERGCGDER